MAGTEHGKLRLIAGGGSDGAPPLLDFMVIDGLRNRLGVYAFDELYEDALFEITERLAAIEAAMKDGALARAASLAEKLGGDAFSIGFARCAAVARDLAFCILKGDPENAQAIADRLIAVGEDSLVRVASLTNARWRDSS